MIYVIAFLLLLIVMSIPQAKEILGNTVVFAAQVLSLIVLLAACILVLIFARQFY